MTQVLASCYHHNMPKTKRNDQSGIRGTYHSVSAKHLQSYLDEYAFRYNHREEPGGMFEAFLGRIAKASD